MSWVLFWQLFALVPWVCIWVYVVVTAWWKGGSK